jgi:hypothetical protein
LKKKINKKGFKKKKKKKKLVTIDDKLVTHPNFNDKLVIVDHGAITTSEKI